MGSLPQAAAQPPDERYVHVFLDAEILDTARRGLERYRGMLENLGDIEASFFLERSPVAKERATVDRLIKWCSEGDRITQVTYGTLRWIKAGILLEIERLKELRIQTLRKFAALPKALVESLNSRIASFENLAETGVFNGLNPREVMTVTGTAVSSTIAASDDKPAVVAPPRLEVRVELLDPELRRRCGDLFEQFAAEPVDQDRLDTVLREAGAVLEERIRKAADLPVNLIGLDLISRAFAADNGELILSNDRNEQEGAHLLFRGFFGFVRNTVAHHLVPAYTKERASQMLGFVDYLLFILSQAKRRNPPLAATGANP